MDQRDKIIDSALDLFLRHGIRKMRVQQLAGPMAVSTKTLYKHFKDKEDLLKQCLLRHYSLLAKQFDSIENQSSNPVKSVSSVWHEAVNLDFGVNHVFYHDLNYYYPKLQDSVIKKVFRDIPSKLRTQIKKGIQQGFFRNDIKPEVALEAMDLLYSSLTRSGIFKKLRLSPQVIMQNTMDAYIRGLCTEKGTKELDKFFTEIKQ